MNEDVNRAELLPLVADIVAAHVSNNKVPAAELTQVVRTVYDALIGLSLGAIPAVKPEPATTVKKSVTPDHLVCMDCGAEMKMLKRHLRTEHGLSPDDYRKRWGLSRDYPMVAATYAKQRSKLAKAIGLGKKRRSKRAQALVSKRSTRSRRVTRK